MSHRLKSHLQLERELMQEIKDLTHEVQKLKNLEFIKVFKHPWKFMGFSLLKGLMVGFGSVLGASVLVGFFIYLLTQISLVPVIGDFVKDILSQIQVTQPVKTEAVKTEPETAPEKEAVSNEKTPKKAPNESPKSSKPK